MTSNENVTNTNELDYSVVNSYWKRTDPSIMSPYLMGDFGFPTNAGRYRFLAEFVIVQQLIHNSRVDTTGAVLDLGSGIGYWAEYFALRFKKVVAVESSMPLYKSMEERCSSYDNLTPIHDDALTFKPEDQFSLIFLGGLLMCLNENDAIALLKKLKPFLAPEGIILCRESTVRNGTVSREGDYQAVYRSVQTYLSLFNQCGLTEAQIFLNTPYILMQIGCELVNKWKAYVPKNLQFVSAVGYLTYWGLRLGSRWITRIPSAIGVDFPELTNHFFLIRPASQAPNSDKTRPSSQ